MLSATKNSLRAAAVVLAVLLSLPTTAQAHKNDGYSHDDDTHTTNWEWITWLKDDVRLSELSIPGTHDTMALHGGDLAETQKLTLNEQLKSGIRVLDIRCRLVEDVFAIHHGAKFEDVFFGDVLDGVIMFLRNHPYETVLMRVAPEYHADSGRPFDPTLYYDRFEATFHDRYWEPNKVWFYKGASDNPTVKEMRGKIVVLQKFYAYNRYGLKYETFKVQDDYELKNKNEQYDKWRKVKKQLKAADEGDSSVVYMNWLNGAGTPPNGGGVYPYFVASGHSSAGTSAPRMITGKTTPGWNDWHDFPRVNCLGKLCTIDFEGTNVLTYERLGKDYKKRVGIVMADFPGPGLIKRLIKLNDPYKR